MSNSTRSVFNCERDDVRSPSHIQNRIEADEQGDGQAATVDRCDFGIAGFNADEARAKLKTRNLKYADGNSKESFKFHDPDGFYVQLNAPDYVGHVS